ncbi:rhodanese-like domain-containing protein [Marinoscillum furvescens]|uniref:rhodanese-like domain-containing protein n=1 Tax=Marinoscillum furvescens TaxID=1026 RepID=UPI0037427511
MVGQLNWLSSKDTVVICQSGKRSAIGAQLLLDHGFARVWSVKGGIEGVKQI